MVSVEALTLIKVLFYAYRISSRGLSFVEVDSMVGQVERGWGSGQGAGHQHGPADHSMFSKSATDGREELHGDIESNFATRDGRIAEMLEECQEIGKVKSRVLLAMLWSDHSKGQREFLR